MDKFETYAINLPAQRIDGANGLAFFSFGGDKHFHALVSGMKVEVINRPSYLEIFRLSESLNIEQEDLIGQVTDQVLLTKKDQRYFLNDRDIITADGNFAVACYKEKLFFIHTPKKNTVTVFDHEGHCKEVIEIFSQYEELQLATQNILVFKRGDSWTVYRRRRSFLNASEVCLLDGDTSAHENELAEMGKKANNGEYTEHLEFLNGLFQTQITIIFNDGQKVYLIRDLVQLCSKTILYELESLIRPSTIRLPLEKAVFEEILALVLKQDFEELYPFWQELLILGSNFHEVRYKVRSKAFDRWMNF